MNLETFYPLAFLPLFPAHKVRIEAGRRRDSVHVERKDEEDLRRRLNGNPTLAASLTVWGLSWCEWAD